MVWKNSKRNIYFNATLEDNVDSLWKYQGIYGISIQKQNKQTQSIKSVYIGL